MKNEGKQKRKNRDADSDHGLSEMTWNWLAA
jgi:hypothetical protein